MFSKIYAFFQNNRKEIIIFLALLLIFNIRFPYFIESPGGTLSLKDRFEIEDGNRINGDISSVYVAERPATIPTLLLSLLFKDWDIIKKEEIVYDNETTSDAEARGRITLNQGINTAVVYAFQKAGKKIDILATKLYVIFVYEDAKTTLKVGDQILEIDGIKVLSRKDISGYISNLNDNDEITIKVLNDGKEYERKANITVINDNRLIGIMTSAIYDYKLSQDVKYKNNSSEMGSSGGFANTLYIYSSLIDEDLIKGRKIVATGTIDSEGNIGGIGGLKYKIAAAFKNKASLFFIPDENCEEAKEIKKEKNYDIDLVCIKTFDDAIEYLKK